MTTMGKYCRAYPVSQLRCFSGWREQGGNLSRENREVIYDREVEFDRSLTDNDYLYLQENYVVTEGVFKDERIAFGDVTPEWITFCQQELGFEVPAWARGEPAENTESEI